MGYDLHITRRKDWSGTGNDITAQEWLAYVKKDPELLISPENGATFALWNGKSEYPDPWLDWSGGNIYTKNPDQALIDKMVAIAGDLHAVVQGDDGEIYRGGGEPPYYPKLSLRDRFLRWISALRPVKRLPLVQPAFSVGDRVRDVFRREATVIEIDPHAIHRLGKVKLRYDDGKVSTWALAGSQVDPVRKESDKNT
jgi:hypothetical protein